MLSSSSDEDFGGSELECSSLSVFVEDELSPSFLLSLNFWKESCPLVSFLLKQLWEHLLKSVDRFLLSLNHIKLFPLNSVLLLKLIGYFFESAHHISKGYCLWIKIWEMRFDDGGVLIIHLFFSKQQTIVNWGNRSHRGPSVSVDPFRFYKNILQIWRSVDIRLLWTDS